MSRVVGKLLEFLETPCPCHDIARNQDSVDPSQENYLGPRRLGSARFEPVMSIVLWPTPFRICWPRELMHRIEARLIAAPDSLKATRDTPDAIPDQALRKRRVAEDERSRSIPCLPKLVGDARA